MVARVLFLNSVLIAMLVSSCSYEKTALDIGSLFDPTWDFSSTSGLAFDENYVEVKNDQVQLKLLDLKHEGDDFNNGNHVGTFLNSDSRTQIFNDKNSLTLSVDKILESRKSNLIGYWKLDGNSLDSIRGNNGSLVDDAQFTTDSKVGPNAISLDGTSDYINLGSNLFSDADFAKGTISLWAYISGDSDTHDEASFLDIEGIITLRYNELTNKFRTQLYDGSNHYLESPDDLLIGQWHHLTLSWDGTEVIQYINGIESNKTSAGSPTLESFDRMISIGSNWGGSDFINGRVDEVAAWNVNLDPLEIKLLFERQSLQFTSLSSSWTPKWNSIVGYWKMDGNWLDSSGNGNHGSRLGTGDSSPEFSTGSQVGTGSGSFDDTDDYVSVSYASGLNPPTFTLSAWVKSSSSSGNNMIFNNQNGSFYFDLKGTPSGFVCIYINSVATAWNCSTSSATDGKWHHVVAVYDSVQSQVYFDGQLESTYTGAGGSAANPSNNLEIGRRLNPPVTDVDYFDGDIDEAVIWNTPLEASDISRIYQRQKQKYAGHYDSEVVHFGGINTSWPDLGWSTSLPYGKELVGDFDNSGSPDSESSSDYSEIYGDLGNNLVGLWHLNETAAGTVAGGTKDLEDSSGLNSHGSEVGTVEYKKAGLFKEAIEFDGATGYFDLGDSPYDFTSDFTLSAWFRLNSVPTGYADSVLSKAEGSGYGIDVRTNMVLHFDVHDGVAYRVSKTANPISLGRWYHVVGQVSGSEVAIFVDGVKSVNTGTLLGPTSTNNLGLLVGANPDGGPGSHFFDGSIDEVGVWSRALSETEIQQLYRRGVNRIKYQVKSCVDPSCECKSLNTSPLGSATDCDGDTIINALDFDDVHKAEFIGPGGDGTTYYSELFNRKASDLTFNCGTNTSDSDGNVCMNDEITLEAGPRPTSPIVSYSDLPLAAKPGPNPYFQYRVHMEADENMACDGSPCFPELTSVDLNSGGQDKYYGGLQEVIPTIPLAYSSIQSIELNADNCVTYQLSPDGTNYFYVNDGVWVAATELDHRSSKLELENYIVKYSEQFAPGFLHIKAFLATNSNQTSSCSLRDIDVVSTN